MHKPAFLSVSIGISIAFVMLFLSSTPGGLGVSLASVQATTYYVNGATGDDSNTCLSPVAACQTISAALALATDGDTIQVAAGTYSEALDISNGVTLQGEGSASTFLDGSDSFRVIQAGASQPIVIKDVTIQNGLANSGLGGGAITQNGPLTLQNVIVTDNHSAVTGGGAILANNVLQIIDSQVISNTATGVGGGILIWSLGDVTVSNSRIGGNNADQGGGIYATGDLLLEDSTLDGNTAANFGGALAVFNGTSTLNRTTVSNNTAVGYGAGLLNNFGVMNLTNVTISSNSAPNYVGLVNISSSATTSVLNSTIAGNSVIGTGTRYGGVANINDGIISIQNTVVAGNGGRNCLASGSWTSLGNNLSSDIHCAFTASGDQQNTEPLLAPLGNYGGPTETRALLAGSPAIDAGNGVACPATDQRGVSRPQDGNNSGSAICDIGAYETRSQLTVADISLNEGTGGSVTATFTVSLSPSSPSTVTMQYATSNGTATAGSDYTTANGTLTFDPGETSQIIDVTVTSDGADENDETFFLNLSNPSNADLVDGQASATIIDDDGLSSLTINDVTITEGNSGSSNAQFTVTLSPASSQTVTVNFATSNASATVGSDYTSASGQLTFDPGETNQTINVSITGDIVDEGAQETFNLNLSSASNASLADATGQGVISDDDLARLSINAPASVAEGDVGQVLATFTVSLSTPAAFVVTVDYATSSGVGGVFATPGVDYIDTSGTLTFSAGDVSETFTVAILGDTQFEPDENFSATLSNPNPVTIQGAASTGYILNDDQAKLFLPVVVK